MSSRRSWYILVLLGREESRLLPHLVWLYGLPKGFSMYRGVWAWAIRSPIWWVLLPLQCFIKRHICPYLLAFKGIRKQVCSAWKGRVSPPRLKEKEPWHTPLKPSLFSKSSSVLFFFSGAPPKTCSSPRMLQLSTQGKGLDSHIHNRHLKLGGASPGTWWFSPEMSVFV